MAQNRIRASCFVAQYIVCKTDVVLRYLQGIKEI